MPTVGSALPVARNEYLIGLERDLAICLRQQVARDSHLELEVLPNLGAGQRLTTR